jgi:hypothetical protein
MTAGQADVETTHLAELTALYMEMEDRRVDCVTVQNAIKAEIRRRNPSPGRYPAGNLLVEITPNRRFKPDWAALLLTDRQLSLITVPVPDANRARKLLTPDEYALCQVQVGDNRVRIR